MAIPEGTAGEPAAAASGSQGDDLLSALDGGAGTGTGEPAATSEADAEHLKWLESIDPGKLPANVRAKLEAPFLSQYTRKMTDAGKEAEARQQRFLDAITERLTANGAPAPTPDQRAELLEKIRSGDMEVLDQFIDRTLDTRLAPVKTFMDSSLKEQAIAKAREMHPWVKEKEAEIGQFLQQNPAIAKLASQNNYEAAPLVLTAIAQSMELAHLKATQKAAVEKAVADAKKTAASLPSSTSRAGTTPSGTGNGKSNSLWEAMEKSFAESGLPEHW